MMAAGTCPVSRTEKQIVFFEAQSVPVHCNVLCPDRESAVATPRGDIRLAFYPDSGMIFNVAFDPKLMEYSQEYENSLHYSPHFQEFAAKLVDRLVKKYDLHDRDIVDIGCGKGDFLHMICQAGKSRGYGFDPSYEGDREAVEATAEVKFVKDFYGEKYTHQEADFIACRHVLEHIDEPIAFLQQVRRAIGDREQTAVYFEVPNAMWTLRDLGIWDIIYEHCSYYTAPSMSLAFELAGFRVVHVEAGFGGQFLGLEAVPVTGEAKTTERQDEIRELAGHVEAFGEKYREKLEEWNAKMGEIRGRDQKVVVWGAGSKGVTFLNTVQGGDHVDYIVDVNPKKQGMFVPGAAQEIVPPEFLKDYAPDVVILMNPNYRSEIEGALRNLGVGAEVQVV